jgi:hypothetical protein
MLHFGDWNPGDKISYTEESSNVMAEVGAKVQFGPTVLQAKETAIMRLCTVASHLASRCIKRIHHRPPTQFIPSSSRLLQFSGVVLKTGRKKKSRSWPGPIE